MPITDPARLPGAFLFLTIKTPGGNFAGVAYDENITKGTKLKDLRDRYLGGSGSNLPYMERFAPLPTDNTLVWQGQNLVSYGGIFGGPDPKSPHPLKRSPVSLPWPYAETDNHPIRHGVYVSYWNFPSGGKGIHTSSISRHFNKGSEVPYVTLFTGSKANLVPINSLLIRQVVTDVYVDWYATFEGDLGWSTETIPS